jgi:hypothetical protein
MFKISKNPQAPADTTTNDPGESLAMRAQLEPEAQKIDPPAHAPTLWEKAVTGFDRRRNLILLGAVAIWYLLVQLVLITPFKYLGFDESLYVSQFAPGIPAGHMSAPRAFGMPLIAAPVVLITSSVAVLRLYLMLLSSVALFCAFWPWLKLRDTPAIPLAALLFSGVWLSVFYGNEVMPNVYTACCTVAATGCFLLAVRQRAGWRPLAGVVAAFAVISLIRPLDALWVLAPLVAAAVLYRPWRHLAPLAAIAVGSAVGWVPWVIESYLRFDGLIGRIEEMEETNAGGLQFVVLRQLQSFGSGRILCGAWTEDCGRYTVGAVLMWCGLAILAAAGLWTMRNTSFHAAGLLAAGVAICQAVPYFFLTGHANPRYLLPTYALLFIPAAVGLGRLGAAARRRLPKLGAVLVPVLVIIFLGDQFAVAAKVGNSTKEGRLRQLHIGKRLVKLGVQPPCLVYGRGAPAIAHVVRCRYRGVIAYDIPPAGRPAATRRIEKRLTREASRGIQVVVVGAEPDRDDFLPTWSRVRLTPKSTSPVLLSPAATP